jgi:hypothetical protein
MERYWVLYNRRIVGPVEPEQLCRLKDFSADTKVCQEGHEEWQPASFYRILERSLPPSMTHAAEDLRPQRRGVPRIAVVITFLFFANVAAYWGVWKALNPPPVPQSSAPQLSKKAASAKAVRSPKKAERTPWFTSRQRSSQQR